MLIKKIVKFFDKLEDETRGALSHYPILYGFLGGIGVVLFWRGVWHISDEINLGSITSIILGSFILLMTGVFVSAFIGNKLIISGIVGEKKLSEKAKEEIQSEEAELENIQRTLDRVEKKISAIEEEIKDK
jgi:uncharacterized membrane protein